MAIADKKMASNLKLRTFLRGSHGYMPTNRTGKVLVWIRGRFQKTT